jgi:hypothetical protein
VMGPAKTRAEARKTSAAGIVARSKREAVIGSLSSLCVTRASVPSPFLEPQVSQKLTHRLTRAHEC